MTNGRKARSSRRLLRAAAESRDMAALALATAGDLGDSDDPEDRAAARYWRAVAARLGPVGEIQDLATTESLAALERGIRYMSGIRDDRARELHASGVSWERIGLATGLTREGARKRWSRFPP